MSNSVSHGAPETVCGCVSRHYTPDVAEGIERLLLDLRGYACVCGALSDPSRATDVPPAPAYERRGDCPSWCSAHTWDTVPTPPLFTGHTGTLGDGADELELFLTVDGASLGAADMGNVERTPEQLRAFAARLVEAAAILEQ